MYKLIRPFLFSGDAENVHERTIALGETLAGTNLARLAAWTYRYEDPSLRTSLWGLDFQNPVGLAAGFDKNGRLVNFMPALGFGFIETGTVTPVGQPGNDRPRLFRLPQDEAIINRMGFNNEGMAELARRLQGHHAHIPVGANIGKNKDTSNEAAVADYEKCFKRLAPVADYIVVNVSSPNTPNLRELQEKDSLQELLLALAELNNAGPRRVPLLLKIAPDLADEALEDIVSIVKEIGLDGVIATNTTISRENLRAAGAEVERIGAGGLSGAPVRRRATEVISFLFRRLGRNIPVIGVGGIFSAADAYEKIRAGAALVQVWTGLVYEGPGLVKHINRGLAEMLRRDGFSNISEAVGANHKRSTT